MKIKYHEADGMNHYFSTDRADIEVKVRANGKQQALNKIKNLDVEVTK